MQRYNIRRERAQVSLRSRVSPVRCLYLSLGSTSSQSRVHTAIAFTSPSAINRRNNASTGMQRLIRKIYACSSDLHAEPTF